MGKGFEVKICGIKTQEEIAFINRYPVDYAGLIFAPSKRQVSLEKGKEIRPLIRKDIKVVGVFVDATYQEINRAIVECDLNVVQLHGKETNDEVLKIPVEVWKSIPIENKNSLLQIRQYPDCDGVLLDTYYKGATGGTGQSFNHKWVNDYGDISQKLILAGGLSPDNVLSVLENIIPDVLDFNSGLETKLMKDPLKVDKLFKILAKYYEEEMKDE
ncbi:phosphoribosylanthranilate isomerase [Petrocella sp. FN5]|uniref:phosphoribosylanthranilate isomerase n=1 Tax=Petrocella sp. FN5 TaxID=3032002 RepID=UPI0023DBA697|nr:phosphoribosylanthranilate isomerase [Petrocella sp. FN5]MDF1617577.1 phosphoribosylanthranilate isomerase [Petrocella sp. FN5]